MISHYSSFYASMVIIIYLFTFHITFTIHSQEITPKKKFKIKNFNNFLQPKKIKTSK